MKQPKRRVTLRIEVGGDSWTDVSSALESIVQRIDCEGPITSLISGGWSSGYHVTGVVDEDQTGDKFRQENHEYVKSLKEDA